MYSKQEWDDIYKFHFYDAPWMSESCAKEHLVYLDRYLPEVREKKILDYGCGNGLIAYHFFKKGAIVDLVDISDNLVTWLKDRYTKVGINNIFRVSTPQDIDNDNNMYDIIIANSLFHHIQPELWTNFLKGFAELLKPDGLLVLSGWDETEAFAKNKEAPYTKKVTWPISKIDQNIKLSHRFSIVNEEVHPIRLPEFFKSDKIFKYYVLKKNKK